MICFIAAFSAIAGAMIYGSLLVNDGFSWDPWFIGGCALWLLACISSRFCDRAMARLVEDRDDLRDIVEHLK